MGFCPTGECSVIRFGPFELDRTQGLQRDKEELRISPKSLSVLWELASRAGQLVTKDHLFGTVWADAAVSDSALTSCIQELRHVLRDDARRPQFIETLYRRGYRFVAKTSTSAQKEPIRSFAAADSRRTSLDGSTRSGTLWKSGRQPSEGSVRCCFSAGNPASERPRSRNKQLQPSRQQAERGLPGGSVCSTMVSASRISRCSRRSCDCAVSPAAPISWRSSKGMPRHGWRNARSARSGASREPAPYRRRDNRATHAA